jgi:ribosomal protein S20
MDLQIGSTVGDYQVIGILGAGGMGKVYKVRNVISDRVEAMKVLLPDLANAPDLADRFLREIKVQASLEHPNIASLHTALRVENQLLMLMEFVEGSTLEQALKEQVRLPVDRAANYISQVLSALDYAHAHGVIHRDIKPANMMLTPSGVVKLMDFGIAKASSDHKLTMTGTTLGSLYYMSPEQIQGAVNLDARSDLYSVGVSLYELVTGKRPFDGDSQFAIMSAHLKNTPIPPVAIDPTLPPEINDVILLSVAKDPANRFQTAAAFKNALSSVTPGAAMAQAAAAVPPPAMAGAPAPNPAYAPVVSAAAGTRPRSRRGLWMALGGIATAGVLVGVIQLAPWKGTKAAPQTPVPAVVQAPSAAPAQEMPAQAAPAQEPTATPALPAQITPTAPPVSAPPAPAASAAPVRRPAPPPARQGGNAAAPMQTPAARPNPEPVASQAPVTQAPPPAAAPAQPSPQAPPVNAAALDQAREDITLLQARATTIRNHSLWRSQAAGGLGIRSDAANARSLMETYLRSATDALNSGNAQSAKSNMEKAERQIEILEKILN